jgi:hypothetical protein
MKFTDIKSGFPVPLPCPLELEELVDWSNSNGYPISGYFELRADDGDTMFYWFGFRDVEARLGQFGAGPDGSLYCVWDAGNDRYPIVHMGSEGQENKVLASSFIDFLRLLAIGYGEIGFEDMSMPPHEDESNSKFRAWVENRFKVSIPSSGIEITKSAQANEPDFQQWIDQSMETYS